MPPLLAGPCCSFPSTTKPQPLPSHPHPTHTHLNVLGPLAFSAIMPRVLRMPPPTLTFFFLRLLAEASSASARRGGKGPLVGAGVRPTPAPGTTRRRAQLPAAQHAAAAQRRRHRARRLCLRRTHPAALGRHFTSVPEQPAAPAGRSRCSPDPSAGTSNSSSSEPPAPKSSSLWLSSSSAARRAWTTCGVRRRLQAGGPSLRAC